MLADEVFQNVVGELHLALRLADFAAGVIHQHAEVSHAQVVHLLQFGAECIQLVEPFILMPAHGVGGVNGPHETHKIAVGVGNEVFQLGRLLLGIGLVAAAAVVVGIILRGVDVSVHLVASHETEDGAAGFEAPRGTVVAFHYAAEGQVRPVYQYAHGQFPQLGHLAQTLIGKHIIVRQSGILHIVQHLDDGLARIVTPGFIVGIDGELARLDENGVAFGYIRKPFPDFALAFGRAHENLNLLHPGSD